MRIRRKNTLNHLRTVRTALGLRDTLFDELDMLRRGESSSIRAATVARLAGQILNAAWLEVELAKTRLDAPLLLGFEKGNETSTKIGRVV